MGLHEVGPLRISIVGVGGVGSPLALLLAKHGHELVLYDPDRVEPKNVHNQLYGPEDAYQLKVEALAQHLADLSFAGGITHAAGMAVKADTLLGTPVVIMCVDTLEARRDILHACIGSPEPRILIDVRVGHGSIKVYAVSLADSEGLVEYEASLAGEGMAGMCVVQFEVHVGFMAAALAVRALGHITNPDIGGVERLLILDVDTLGVVQDGPHPWIA